MARTEPARGMRDFLPEDVRRRTYAIGVIAGVYERYGYEPLETPAVENLETLLGKYGEEGNRLIFKILKRGVHESSGEADLALRYDLTVPLARVVAQHQARLPRLFKRYQIQPVWRADRPARGRFREFYQCDVDAIGSTSPAVDAELCAAATEALTALGFEDFTIRLNHRRLLGALLRSAGVPEAKHGDALVAIDKLDKIGLEGVDGELAARGIADAPRRALAQVLAPAARGQADPAAALARLATLVADDAEGRAAVENLEAIVSLARATAAGPRLRVDAALARGLSYYTGAIMEVAVPQLAGSLGGGGRYDNLVGMFLGQPVPACGFSLGLERILVVMTERGMFPPTLRLAPADVLLAVMGEADVPQAFQAAARLRRSGLRVLVYPDAGRIGRQIRYADARGIRFVAILGEDEIRAGTVTVKDLAGQRQQTYPLSEAGPAIQEQLAQRG